MTVPYCLCWVVIRDLACSCSNYCHVCPAAAAPAFGGPSSIHAVPASAWQPHSSCRHMQAQHQGHCRCMQQASCSVGIARVTDEARHVQGGMRHAGYFPASSAVRVQGPCLRSLVVASCKQCIHTVHRTAQPLGCRIRVLRQLGVSAGFAVHFWYPASVCMCRISWALQQWVKPQ